MARRAGLSVRLRLTLSYAGFLMVAGVLLLATVRVFLLRYVPDGLGVGPGPYTPSRSDLQEAFDPRAFQALAFLLVVGLVGGWFLAGRMLSPLARITAATRAAAQGSLSHRIALPGRSDEFRELADAFDAMLERLEAHVEEQRRFAANASHELRTPLAVMQTLLEVARDDPGRDTDELLERLQSVNRRAIALTEALLVLSQADRRSFPRVPVDLSLAAEQAAETLLPEAEARDVRVETLGEPVDAHGSPTLLTQMTTNLVHNAIVHNLPAGGGVTVTTDRHHGSARLVVESTGATLSPALVATLVEPFQRGAERTRGDHGGVGLGLAIVDSVVRAHDGTLELTAREEGGLRVTVVLPVGVEPAAPGPLTSTNARTPRDSSK